MAHSDLSPFEKTRILPLSRNGLINAAKKHRLPGNLQTYIDGIKSFQVPVYALWGNHEDSVVVSDIFRGAPVVENLHILHHRQAYRVGLTFVYGLGGNLLSGIQNASKTDCRWWR